MPQSVCWDVFKGSDVTGLLPSGGGKVTVDEDPAFDPYSTTRDSANCVLYVDGNTKFLVSVKRHASTQTIDWSTWDGLAPVEVPVGTKAIVWGNKNASLAGASSYVACDSSAPGPTKFLELEVVAQSAPDTKRARATLKKQIQDFTKYASSELECSAR